jgi:hypothetical protein
MIFIFVEKTPTLKKRVRKLGRKRLLKMPAALFTSCYWWLFAARYFPIFRNCRRTPKANNVNEVNKYRRRQITLSNSVSVTAP